MKDGRTRDYPSVTDDRIGTVRDRLIRFGAAVGRGIINLLDSKVILRHYTLVRVVRVPVSYPGSEDFGTSVTGGPEMLGHWYHSTLPYVMASRPNGLRRGVRLRSAGKVGRDLC